MEHDILMQETEIFTTCFPGAMVIYRAYTIFFDSVVLYDKLAWHTYRLPYILLYSRRFGRFKATYYESNHIWIAVLKSSSKSPLSINSAYPQSCFSACAVSLL